ncbi:hypothetical protein [Dietzia sp. 179-F 9C3 NHS]|uniref:hypothetical protein n=1 Tax=Dietzia sp. 179-F 9C3 NHS TaxID=3374295 RepID=UPI003879E63A
MNHNRSGLEGLTRRGLVLGASVALLVGAGVSPVVNAQAFSSASLPSASLSNDASGVEDDAPGAEAGPRITVSDTTLPTEGEHQITVTGTGFNDPSVLGTRPPLAGQPSGAYVVFGKFLDEWKPSADAPSSARKVIEQWWALPTVSFNERGGEPPYIEIDGDGNFSTTFTVFQAEPELGGNYGIYTYAAGGAVKEAYEQYVPIVFSDEDAAPAAGSVAGILNSISGIFGS